ncbi:hypothetical protein ACHWQZ_G006491 [Mnemiopsis leidyi]
MELQNYRFIVMVAFSKFLIEQLGSHQLLGTDGFTYNLLKDRTISSTTTWRCSKNRSKKCPCFVYFNATDESITAGPKEHNQHADPPIEQKNNLIISLKRKAEDQLLTSTQNILTGTLIYSTPELNITLPKLESLAPVLQRARVKSSGSMNHSEALTSAEFELPPTCQFTQQDEDFAAYDGRTEKGSCVIIFATTRNLVTLAEVPNWIADETFYVALKQFYPHFSPCH